jgi:pSer/pThr/pTyr-binding forkhead associated (FHA) protein
MKITLTDGKTDYVLPDQPEITIGRSKDSNIVIAHNNVSRKHCTLFRRNGQLFVMDTGSHNGTAINTVPIKNAEFELKHGDKLVLAGVLALTVKIGEGAQSKTSMADTKEGSGPLKLAPENSVPPKKDNVINDAVIAGIQKEAGVKPTPKPAAPVAAQPKPAPAAKPAAPVQQPKPAVAAKPETTKSLVAQAQAAQKPNPPKKFLGITFGGGKKDSKPQKK